MEVVNLQTLLTKYTDRQYRDPYNKGRYFEFIEDLKKCVDYYHNRKIILIEDGSVDLDADKQDLEDMDFKVVVYRSGATPPQILEK